MSDRLADTFKFGPLSSTSCICGEKAVVLSLNYVHRIANHPEKLPVVDVRQCILDMYAEVCWYSKAYKEYKTKLEFMLSNFEKSTRTCVKTVRDIARALEYECEQLKRRIAYAEEFRRQCQTSQMDFPWGWGKLAGTDLMHKASMVVKYWTIRLNWYETELANCGLLERELRSNESRPPPSPPGYSRAESDQAQADMHRRIDGLESRLDAMASQAREDAARAREEFAFLRDAILQKRSSPLNESPSPSHSSAPTGGAHESAPCQSDAAREPPEPSPSLLIPQLPQAEPSAVAPATPAEAVPVTVISACGPQSTAEDDAILTALAAKPVVCVSPSHHEWCSVLDTPDIPSSEHAHARELLHRDARPTVVRTVDLSHLLSIAYAHNRKLVAAR